MMRQSAISPFYHNGLVSSFLTTEAANSRYFISPWAAVTFTWIVTGHPGLQRADGDLCAITVASMIINQLMLKI